MQMGYLPPEMPLKDVLKEAAKRLALQAYFLRHGTLPADYLRIIREGGPPTIESALSELHIKPSELERPEQKVLEERILDLLPQPVKEKVAKRQFETTMGRLKLSREAKAVFDAQKFYSEYRPPKGDERGRYTGLAVGHAEGPADLIVSQDKCLLVVDRWAKTQFKLNLPVKLRFSKLLNELTTVRMEKEKREEFERLASAQAESAAQPQKPAELLHRLVPRGQTPPEERHKRSAWPTAGGPETGRGLHSARREGYKPVPRRPLPVGTTVEDALCDVAADLILNIKNRRGAPLDGERESRIYGADVGRLMQLLEHLNIREDEFRKPQDGRERDLKRGEVLNQLNKVIDGVIGYKFSLDDLLRPLKPDKGLCYSTGISVTRKRRHFGTVETDCALCVRRDYLQLVHDGCVLESIWLPSEKVAGLQNAIYALTEVA